jgi:asparagine synthase (glutamine-hydrolysing)
LSAIVGLLHLRDRPVDPADLAGMVTTLAHRGPDGAASWSQGPVGLGQLLLRTTAESGEGRPPWKDPSGNLVITADVRLDNRAELVDQLELRGRPPATIGDHQLILAAYERWGQDCPQRLLGDFAFAIWDARAEILFCARDHFGVKPLYYYLSGEVYAFASEIKALFSLDTVLRRVNEVRIGEYLVEASGEPASTFFDGVLRLLPAHSLTIGPSGVRLRRYWELDPTRELRLGSDREYALALRELFTESVRCRLRSTVRLGSMLSGGIDSSSITCTARQLLSAEGRAGLHTFSAIFDGVAASDEQHYQNAVLAQNGVVAHSVQGDRLSPLGDLDRVLRHFDQVLDSGNLYLNWNLYKIAQQHEVGVLLDGFDGDTTISHGVGYLSELAYSGRWLALAREVRAFAPNNGESWTAALWGWIRRFGLDPTLARLAAVLPGGLTQPVSSARGRSAAAPSGHGSVWRAIVRPEFAARLDLEGRRHRFWRRSMLPRGRFRSSFAFPSGTGAWSNSACPCHRSRSSAGAGVAW